MSGGETHAYVRMGGYENVECNREGEGVKIGRFCVRNICMAPILNNDQMVSHQ